MRRALAGFRAARIRSNHTVRTTTAVLGLALLLAGCGYADATEPATTPVGAATPADPVPPVATATPLPTTPPTTPPPTTTPSTPPPASSAPATTPPPATTPAPETVQVPTVTGSTTARAQAALSARGLRWTVVTLVTSRYSAGTVIDQTPRSRVRPGTTVTLTVAVAPKPKATPKPAPVPTPAPVPPPTAKAAPAGCDPSYPTVCLKTGIGDYDCSSGSGNGPNYTSGPIKVRQPDPFGLDRDGNGIGCENG